MTVLKENIHFVTGKLAEHSLRQVLKSLAPRVGFDYTVGVLNITVAALMTTPWIARKLEVPAGTTRIIVPGNASGPLEALAAVTALPVQRGPEDLRRLDEFFGQQSRDLSNYGAFDIEILAEINHAPRLSREAILHEAKSLAADGADCIDLGCDPGSIWGGVGDAVKMLLDAGLRVSIDSFEPREVSAAVRAGASLVLSVNSTPGAARLWPCPMCPPPWPGFSTPFSGSIRKGFDFGLTRCWNPSALVLQKVWDAISMCDSGFLPPR